MVNSIFTPILNGLFPNECSLCQWRCPGSLPLCEACREEFPINSYPCQRCALPLATASSRLCGTCQRQPPAFDAALAPWLYGEYLAYLLRRWKFEGEQRLTPLLAELWIQQVPVCPAVDSIVPVPLHWSRQWRRGYNQAALLAWELQKNWPHLHADGSLLQRNRRTRAQSGMNARQRAGNLRGAFTANDRCANLRVAVVDDVLTTGATANEIARTLKTAGATHVEIWSLARTPPPGD